MLKYRTRFIRALILLWLVTWTSSDPLYLLQGLLGPQDITVGSTVLRAVPLEDQISYHHQDLLLNGPTESNSKGGSDKPSDELNSSRRADLDRSNNATLKPWAAKLPPLTRLPASVSPRSPPSRSL